MEFKYGLEDRPPLGESLLMGLQWCALMLPFLIILGKIAGAYHLADPAFQTAYLQKMAFITAVFLVLEILWGHRLPLVIGPSSVILIGIISSHGVDLDAISTAVISGGVILAFAGLTGFFGHLQRLFTPRVVAVVLLLIAFTLTPTILTLVSDPQGTTPQVNMIYALALTAFTLILHRFLAGIW
ncbi:MAG: solute carrier family 23 protein, partial [Syntrophales bacterium]